MYYQRLDVKRAITDFAGARGSNGFRECAIFNKRIKSLQRHLGDKKWKYPVVLNSPSAISQVVGMGASAFYCSYWRYDGLDFTRPLGRDLVWAVRAKHGGLEFAKSVTAWVLKALEDIGIEPWVKYSGDLGFDLIIPLETIPYEAWMGDLELLNTLQKELTDSIVSYLHERFSDVIVEGATSSVEIKQGVKICRLSELRARRGLLLAPMSLNPETGLVSIPVDPKRINVFSVLDASPSNARPFEWSHPPTTVNESMKYTRLWWAEQAQTRLAKA